LITQLCHGSLAVAEAGKRGRGTPGCGVERKGVMPDIKLGITMNNKSFILFFVGLQMSRTTIKNNY